jgi:ferredoxin-NADP reductase
MEISRSYTPVRLFHTVEETPSLSLHFLIKVYPEGALTPQLGKLSPGDQVCVSDHTGSFSTDKLSSCQSIYLLAAGTGCTPIFSLLHELSQIKTQVQTKLLFFRPRQILSGKRSWQITRPATPGCLWSMCCLRRGRGGRGTGGGSGRSC